MDFLEVVSSERGEIGAFGGEIFDQNGGSVKFFG
jgi:hypothetical protein